jgi:hypothetical protein
MEEIEHHPNPESDEPDQAKRMQTSMSHLMPGQSNGKDHRDQFGFLPGRNTMDAIV